MVPAILLILLGAVTFMKSSSIQHLPSPPKALICKGRGEMHGVHKHLRLVAQKVAHEYENQRTECRQLSGRQCHQELCPSSTEHIYIYI